MTQRSPFTATAAPRSTRELPKRIEPRRPELSAPVRTDVTHATILLVDDDAAVLESLRRVLITEGLHVITARSGEEALAFLETHSPSLVITDLCMATVTGWDLLYHEHFERPGVPFFVITALPPKATGGADTFATEFFQKPLDLDALIAAVHRHLVPRTLTPPLRPTERA
jgi:DNA-binding NtrC family response regulator